MDINISCKIMLDRKPGNMKKRRQEYAHGE